MGKLTPQQVKKQELYRDARFTKQYDDIWQSVGKCVFCDLNEKYVFYEENGVVMTISLFAYIDGHFMIMPRRHIRSAKDLTELEWATIRKFTYMAKKIIKSVHGVKGMQLVQKDGAEAQSTVADHIHFHCVPFDAPDLLTWNYRQLKHTPLENVELYKQAGKKLVAADLKFQRKYQQPQTLGVVCDIIISNDHGQILFEERSTDAKLQPDYLTLPGGKVTDITSSLETELAREVLEETGLNITADDVALLSSRIDEVVRPRTIEQLHISYGATDTFVRNTYKLNSYHGQKLQPGDDARKLVWIDGAAIASHERISETTKLIIEQVL